jgi:hypothetical protein
MQEVYFVLHSRSDLKWYTKGLHDVVENQMPTWETLQRIVEELKPNEPFLEKDEGCRMALARISEILMSPRSQETLNELASLVSSTRLVNDRLIDEKCAAAVHIVDNKLAYVGKLLDKSRARPDFRNEVLKPLQEAKRAVQNEIIIAGFASLLEEVEEHFQEAIAVIEDRFSQGGMNS